MAAPSATPADRIAASLTGPERVISTIFRVLALTFGAVGLIFLIFPDGTVRVINAGGALLRIFPPAPPSELRFWLSLGVSYMALVTILAALIQADPRRYRHLMPVLAAGKFCSSFTCLLFFLLSRPAFLYLLNFLVDGSITVLVLGCYAYSVGIEAAATPHLSPANRRILDAVLDTLAPSTDLRPGSRAQLGDDLIVYFRRLHPQGLLGLTLLLQGLEYAPYAFGPRRARFSRLSPEHRAACLAGFEHSRWTVRRQLFASLKLVVMLHVFGYADVQATLGYDGAYLRDKLLAGPNAEYHRLRFP